MYIFVRGGSYFEWEITLVSSIKAKAWSKVKKVYFSQEWERGKFWNPEAQKVVISKDVVFDEMSTLKAFRED